VVGSTHLAAARHRRAAPAPPRDGPDISGAAVAGPVIIAMTVAPTALLTVMPTIVAPTIVPTGMRVDGLTHTWAVDRVCSRWSVR